MSSLQKIIQGVLNYRDALNKPRYQINGNVVHVTAIVSSLIDDIQFPPPCALIRGHLYHHAIESMLTDLFNAETEVKLSKDYNGIKIIGTADAIIHDNDETTLIEIKSSKKSFNYATIQSNIYAWMYGKVDNLLFIDGSLYVQPMPFIENIEEQIQAGLQRIGLIKA